MNRAIRDLAAHARAKFEAFLGGEVWFWSHPEKNRKGIPSTRMALTVHPKRFGLGPIALRAEFHAWSGSFGWHPIRASRESVGTSIAFGPAAYVTLESYDVGRWLGALFNLPKYESVATSISFFDKAVWWEIWTDPDSWSSRTPRWRNGNWHPLDTFFGRHVYKSEIVETAEVVVPMPEAGYRAKIELRRDTWKRPRSPFTRVVMRAHSEMVDPIPVPGKGENSWDCGEDAHFGATAPAETIVDAMLAIYRSAMNSRRRYGDRNGHGLAWRPESKEKAAE